MNKLQSHQLKLGVCFSKQAIISSLNGLREAVTSSPGATKSNNQLQLQPEDNN